MTTIILYALGAALMWDFSHRSAGISHYPTRAFVTAFWPFTILVALVIRELTRND